MVSDGAKLDLTAVLLRLDRVADGVFHQRLQDKTGHRCFERRRIKIYFQPQPIAEPDLLDFQVAPEELDLLQSVIQFFAIAAGFGNAPAPATFRRRR